jgi:hypothetical protein
MIFLPWETEFRGLSDDGFGFRVVLDKIVHGFFLRFFVDFETHASAIVVIGII